MSLAEISITTVIEQLFEPPLQRILVSVDGDELSNEAVDQTVSLAAAAEGRPSFPSLPSSRSLRSRPASFVLAFAIIAALWAPYMASALTP